MLYISLGLCHTENILCIDTLEYYLEKKPSDQEKNNVSASTAVTSPLRHSEHTHWAFWQENMQIFTLTIARFYSYYFPGLNYIAYVF